MSDNRYLPSKEEAFTQLERLNSSAIGRSKNQQKLLEYLLNRELGDVESESAEYKVPKEIEIAVDVFGKNVDFNPADDSTVRVNVSNLRKKLENYYLQEGSSEAFYITIPVGGYRLVFKKNSNIEHVQSDNLISAPSSIPISNNAPSKAKRWPMLLLIASVLINLVAGVFWFNKEPEKSVDIVKKHALWSDFEQSTLPTMIVMGDVYNFSEFDKELNRRRNIIDPAINSDEELQSYLNENPEQPNSTQGYQQSLVTKGSSIALKNFLNLFNTVKKTNFRLASELSVYQLRSFNIIYIGPLNAMGILEPYFKGSHFNLDKQKGILANEDQSLTYSSPHNLSEGYTDYGLFAKVDGPRKNKIYIFSGFSDPSIMQMSWFMSNTGSLLSKEFSKAMNKYNLSSYNNFEILFKVPSIDGIDMKHKIVYGGKVDSRAIWTSE